MFFISVPLGKELWMLSVDDWPILQQMAKEFLDSIFASTTIRHFCRHQEVRKDWSFTFSSQMFYVETRIPTGLGLPLNLSLSGTGVGSLRGGFELTDYIWRNPYFNDTAFLKPRQVYRVKLPAYTVNAWVHVMSYEPIYCMFILYFIYFYSFASEVSGVLRVELPTFHTTGLHISALTSAAPELKMRSKLETNTKFSGKRPEKHQYRFIVYTPKKPTDLLTFR